MAYNASVRTVTDNLIGFAPPSAAHKATRRMEALIILRAPHPMIQPLISACRTPPAPTVMRIFLVISITDQAKHPWFRRQFRAKNYGTAANPLAGQNDQILSEIFDYVRATNIQDASSASPYGLLRGLARTGAKARSFPVSSTRPTQRRFELEYPGLCFLSPGWLRLRSNSWRWEG